MSLFAHEALVLPLWWIDTANVFSKLERNNLISQAGSEQFLHLLKPLPISERLTPGLPVLRKTLDFARRYGGADHTVYLALAMLESMPLASSDDQLYGAAS